ncbi:SLATT domain-containing protein [Paenibacillus lautus]|uniref:SLATT domain-containing protein n=1 Tax=Paenibacillus lautus TaxID=1401 RepID=UPI0039883CEC
MCNNNEESATDLSVFKDLKRRVKITRKARIAASKRLRKKYEYYEKITHIYSLIVLILSIWFITESGEMGLLATKALLVLSLSLTFFTMYVNIRNYKERASNFEANYQSLDILLNKIERLEVHPEDITNGIIKGLHRDYEKLLIEKENHLDIDFMISDPAKYRVEIRVYKAKQFLINSIIAIYPLILFGVVVLANVFLQWGA